MTAEGTCWSEIGASGDKSCARLAEFVHCRNCPEYSSAGRRLFERTANEALLREAAELLAAPKAAASMAALSLVVFRVRREWFALRAVALEQISEVHPVHSIPFRSGAALEGLTNVDGELVLSVSLPALLGFGAGEEAAPDGGRRRRCVIQAERRRYAFSVDEVLGVRRVDPASARPVPATVAKAPSTLTESCVEVDGRTAGLIDHGRLFEAIERSLAW
ncbi:MAG: chemotaxis protein CheW [Bryobacteraceae bacterium]|nr:chemotaxis protein CheW [Bryobacteraceae bacterium]